MEHGSDVANEEFDEAEDEWPEWALHGAEAEYRRVRCPTRPLPMASTQCNFFVEINDRIFEVPAWVVSAMTLPIRLLRRLRPKRNADGFVLGTSELLFSVWRARARRERCAWVHADGRVQTSPNGRDDARLSIEAAADLRREINEHYFPTWEIAREGSLFRTWRLSLAKDPNGSLRLDATPLGPAVPSEALDWRTGELLPPSAHSS